jgi:hypothetical protein
MVTTWWRAVRVLSPNGSEGTTLLVAALRALSTQLRDLHTSLAQLIQRVVQLGVEHSD